jgi:hypothetical protein
VSQPQISDGSRFATYTEDLPDRGQAYEFEGVIPANLVAFNADLEIDEYNYRRHIRYNARASQKVGRFFSYHAAGRTACGIRTFR